LRTVRTLSNDNSEIRRQHVEAIEPDLSAGIGDVLHFASKYTALGAKEQQRAL